MSRSIESGGDVADTTLIIGEHAGWSSVIHGMRERLVVEKLGRPLLAASGSAAECPLTSLEAKPKGRGTRFLGPRTLRTSGCKPCRLRARCIALHCL